MDIRMYDTLTSLPLFQGVSGIDLNRILDGITLHIEYLEQGENFVHQGEPCQQMVFLINGTLEATTLSPDETYAFTEQITGPFTLEADVLYGIQRTWSSTYTAKDTCRLMLIPKSDVTRMLISIEVFRINYLNHLCTLASRRRQASWQSPAPTMRDQLAHFFRQHAILPTGPKHMNIKMRDIGLRLGVTRSLIGKTLHEMQQDGLLTVGRESIDIPTLEKL